MLIINWNLIDSIFAKLQLRVYVHTSTRLITYNVTYADLTISVFRLVDGFHYLYNVSDLR